MQNSSNSQNPDTLLYALVAKGNNIVADYSSKNLSGDEEDLAENCAKLLKTITNSKNGQ